MNATMAEAPGRPRRPHAIDDVRAGADYRSAMVETLTAPALRQLAGGSERTGWPADPVLLWGESGGAGRWGLMRKTGAITSVNGARCSLEAIRRC